MWRQRVSLAVPLPRPGNEARMGMGSFPWTSACVSRWGQAQPDPGRWQMAAGQMAPSVYISEGALLYRQRASSQIHFKTQRSEFGGDYLLLT